MTTPALGSAFPKPIQNLPHPLSPLPTDGRKLAENPAAPVGATALPPYLQPSGRTPTHPLTASSPRAGANVPPVAPAQAKQAENLLKEGIRLANKKQFEPAFQAFQKAYELDPNNERTARALGKILNLGGQPLESLGVLSEFLDRFPNSQVVREMRATIGEALLPQLQSAARSAPQDKQAHLAQIAQEVLWTTLTDQALLAKAQAPQLRESLQALEAQLAEGHHEPQEVKLAALASLQAQAEQIFTLSNLPSLPPQEAQGVRQELNGLGISILGLATRFAKADSDPEIQSQAKIFEAHQALATGKAETAIAIFETISTEGCQKLGGGDAAKGETLLREKLTAAQGAIQQSKPEEAKKALSGISATLLQAHEALERVASQKLVPSNLGILQAWEESVDQRQKTESADANGFFGTIGQIWDNAFGNPTKLDLLAKEAAAEKELIGQVRSHLQKGDFKTVLEALEALAQASLDQESRVKLAYDQVKNGQFDDGAIKIGRLIRYASTAKPDDKIGNEILEEASQLALQSSDASSIVLYGVVGLLSRDPAQAKRAGESYTKQAEKLEKAAKPG